MNIISRILQARIVKFLLHPYVVGAMVLISYAGVLAFVLYKEELFLNDYEENNFRLTMRIEEATEQSATFLKDSYLLGAYNTNARIVFLDNFYIPASRLVNNEKFCIESLSIRSINTFTASLGEYEQSLLTEEAPRCYSSGIIILEPSNLQPVILYLNDDNPFFYPFDRQIGRFDLIISAYVLNQDGEKRYVPISPDILNVDINLMPPRWEKDIIFFSRLGDLVSPIEVNLTLTHPVFYRVLTVILAILTIAVLLTFNRIASLDNFLQIAIAILLGLWGIQQVLVPSYINFPILVNYIILLLYLYLAVFMAIQLFVRIQRHNKLESAGGN